MQYLTHVAFLLAVSLTLGAQDQDSLKIRKFYNENAILWTGSYGQYIVNNKTYPLRQLEEVLRFSPEALYEYHEFKKDRAITISLFAVSTGLLVSALLTSNQNVKIPLAAGSVLVASIGIPFARGWTAHLNRAVWIHNRDILIR